ncbi:MAG TPA: hypothetical protein VHA80_07760 [Solirubrobacterales bacterium]|nr:hypothetical protein [Solirubrobacterales bacterium]
MDHSNRNRTPAELKAIEDALGAERPQPSPLELDRIKLQAIRQAERSRTSLNAKKGTFMKSRLALTLMLVAGFMLSTTGAGLAISGSSGTGSAASSQYVPSGTGGHHPEHESKGVEKSGGNHECESGSGNGGNSGANGGNGGSNNSGENCVEGVETTGGEPTPEVETAPVAAEQTAVVSSGSSLPFTGFVAIPLLIIGLGLIVVGAVIGLKNRKVPSARL